LKPSGPHHANRTCDSDADEDAESNDEDDDDVDDDDDDDDDNDVGVEEGGLLEGSCSSGLSMSAETRPARSEGLLCVVVPDSDDDGEGGGEERA